MGEVARWRLLHKRSSLRPAVGERHVDDWLQTHLPYKHLYNFPQELNRHVIRCDWHVPDLGLYIEYWERLASAYIDRIDIKQKLYADYSLKVVNVYEDDLPSLDRVIPERTAALVPRCRFRKLARKRRTRTASKHRSQRV